MVDNIRYGTTTDQEGKDRYFEREADLPEAREFGPGLAIIGDTAALKISNGSTWSVIGGGSVTPDPVGSIDAGNAVFTLLHDNGISRFDAVDVKATGKFVYVNPVTGLDSRTRAQAMVAETPWQTPRQVYDAATSGDGAYIGSGTYIANGAGDYPDAYHRLGGNSKSASYIATGNVVFKSTNVSNAQGFVNSVPSSGFVYVEGIVFDGENTINIGVENGDMAANAWKITYKNCTVKDFNSYGFKGAYCKSGEFVVDGCYFEGGFSDSAITNGSGTTLAASALFKSSFINNTINLSHATNNLYAIKSLVGASIGVSDVEVILSANTLAIDVTGSNVGIGITSNTPNTPITSNDITINSGNASNESLGIIVRSTSFKTLDDADISSNNIAFNCPAGHAISVGDETGGLQVTGVVEKNDVTGKYYDSNTPHNISLRKNTTSTARYNRSSDSYVCLIASKTAVGTLIESNLTIHGYGADLYAKGCTAATFNKNTCIVTDRYPRRNLGVLSVDSQGGVNTTATTMSNNVVLVTTDDLSKIGALVNITVNQPCTYSNNVYVVPDTIPDTTDLFYVGGTEGGSSGATAYNIDEWRAATSITNGTGTVTVTNERIIKLPLSEILQMVADLGVTL